MATNEPILTIILNKKNITKEQAEVLTTTVRQKLEAYPEISIKAQYTEVIENVE